MADVKIEGDYLDVKFSLFDQLLAFHGSFHIPLAHVTNAYVSDFDDLELQAKVQGSSAGFLNIGYVKMAGVFENPQGLIFCDVTDSGDCLVIDTRGERFPRIAVQLAEGHDPNVVAHEICRSIPDSGPVEG